MKQSLINELKNIAIQNNCLDDETVVSNVTNAMDAMILQNKIYDYSLSLESERIIISVMEKNNSVSYAFQVKRV